MNTFSLSVIASVIGAAFYSAFLFLLGAFWQRIRFMNPARWFWRLDEPKSKVLISASLHNYDPAEHTAYIPTGDTLAVAEIASLMKRIYGRSIDVVYSDPESPVKAWDSTVVLIGGGKDNLTARCLLAALDPPLHAYDHEDAEHDYKGLKNHRREPVISPPVTTLEDSAFIIRTLDPLRRDKDVYIIAGGYTFGTYAAAQWIAQHKKLALGEVEMPETTYPELPNTRPPASPLHPKGGLQI